MLAGSLMICAELSKDGLKMVAEVPRDDLAPTACRPTSARWSTDHGFQFETDTGEEFEFGLAPQGWTILD